MKIHYESFVKYLRRPNQDTIITRRNKQQLGLIPSFLLLKFEKTLKISNFKHSIHIYWTIFLQPLCESVRKFTTSILNFRNCNFWQFWTLKLFKLEISNFSSLQATTTSATPQTAAVKKKQFAPRHCSTFSWPFQLSQKSTQKEEKLKFLVTDLMKLVLQELSCWEW